MIVLPSLLVTVVWIHRCLSVVPNGPVEVQNTTSAQTKFNDSVTVAALFETNSIGINEEVTAIDADLNFHELTSNDSSSRITKVPGLISEAQYKALKNTLWFYVTPVLLLAGVFGNAVGLWFLVWLLIHGHFKQSFYLLLLALISTDLVYLVITFLQNAIMIIEIYDEGLAQTANCYISDNLRVVQYVCYSTCTHLISLMAIERLVHVVVPLWRRNESFRKQTIAIIFAFISMNICFRIPYMLKNEFKQITDPKSNLTVCISVPTPWAKANATWYDNYIVSMLVITQFIPFIATVSANISIIIVLARQKVQRAVLFANEATRGQQYQQYVTTLTLIILSVCLTTSMLPSFTVLVLSYYQPDIYGRTGRERITAAFVSEIGNFLRVISTSTDFVVYIWMSASSRSLLILLVKRKLLSRFQKQEFGMETSTKARSTEDTNDYE